MRTFGFIVGAPLLALLAACSPYGFSKEVSDFDGSVSRLASSLSSAHEALQGDVAASKRRDLVYNQRSVAIPASCRQQPGQAKEGDFPCLVHAVGGSPLIEDPSPIDPRVTEIVTVLKAYTGSLAAVTKASDRADFDKEVQTLAKSVQSLVSASGIAAPVAPVIGAGINLFGWLVGTALDQKRYEALRKYVNYVDHPLDNGEHPMQLLANELDLKLSALALRRRNQLLKDADALRPMIHHGLPEETYRSRLADLESLLAAVDALRRSDPSGAAQGIATAHAELVKAVNNPNIDLKDLLAALGTLKDKVTALQTAVAALGKKGS